MFHVWLPLEGKGERCAFVLNLNPLKFSIIKFSEFSYLSDFVTNQLLVSGDEHETIYESFYEIKNISIFYDFQFLALDIIIGCAV